MNVRSSVKADAQAAELMKPTQRALHHPARDSQSAAMHPRKFADDRLDAARPQIHAMRTGAIAGIALHSVGSAPRRPRKSGNGRNRIHQRQQLRDIVDVGGGDDRGQGNAVGVDDEMMFGAGLAAPPGVGGIGAGQFAPPTARTLALSTTARDQSILSAARRWFSSRRCMASHTPACCQSRNLRQQVMPQQPNSRGRYSQGMPVNSTKRMPVRQARWSRGLRPG